ncbi:MAG: sensor histidine kinase [Pleurocapsa sp. MO_226.B13]|nr:sensor histidine kinase [Pleurocapsa sp. MO_226.B13]
MVRSCLIFNWLERLLATIPVVIIEVFFFRLRFSSFQEFRQYDRVTWKQFIEIRNIETVSNLFLITFCSAILLMMVDALLKEYESRQKLREYTFLIEDRATLAERNRIAREIHDSVGHILTALNIQLDSAIAFWQSQPDEAWDFLNEAKELATQTLDEIRYSVATLRNDPIEKKSIKSTIDLLVKEFAQRTSISPQCEISLTYPLSQKLKITLYRILQEALTNIAKHSEARAVRIKLKSSSQHLHLLIEDNGKGFDPQQNTTGFGLQGMRERVTAMGGNLQISSSIDRGCSITIYIPHSSLKL